MSSGGWGPPRARPAPFTQSCEQGPESPLVSGPRLRAGAAGGASPKRRERTTPRGWRDGAWTRAARAQPAPRPAPWASASRPPRHCGPGSSHGVGAPQKLPFPRSADTTPDPAPGCADGAGAGGGRRLRGAPGGETPGRRESARPAVQLRPPPAPAARVPAPRAGLTAPATPSPPAPTQGATSPRISLFPSPFCPPSPSSPPPSLWLSGVHSWSQPHAQPGQDHPAPCRPPRSPRRPVTAHQAAAARAPEREGAAGTAHTWQVQGRCLPSQGLSPAPRGARL